MTGHMVGIQAGDLTQLLKWLELFALCWKSGDARESVHSGHEGQFPFPGPSL